jgi:hypothetical protein
MPTMARMARSTLPTFCFISNPLKDWLEDFIVRLSSATISDNVTQKRLLQVTVYQGFQCCRDAV